MPKTLLLADDSVVIQKLVGLSFANEDIQLVTTDNGDDALTRAREINPDLVLADVVMPGKNGYEVCAAIKGDAQLAHVPVLLLTGTFEAFDEERARQVGSDGHITKPFEAQGLVDRVTELLARTAQASPGAAAPAAAGAAAAQAPAAAASITPPTAPAAASVPTVSSDDAFDFFDDSVQQLASDEPTLVDATPAGVPAAPVAAVAADPLSSLADDPLAIDGLGDSSSLDDSFGLEPSDPDGLTRAVMPPATAPPPPVAAPPMHDDPGATRVAFDEDLLAADVAGAAAGPGAGTAPGGQSPAAPAASPWQGETVVASTAAADPMLADDLFAETPARPAPSDIPITTADSPPAAPRVDVAAAPPTREPDPPETAAATTTPGAAASEVPAGSGKSDFDVSMSDLGDSFSPGAPMAEADQAAGPSADALPAGPDASPEMRDRIHETLEKVAWEAFADLSDTIVRQVIQRVESVVWEIVPQMAETLIQEEIRRIKGEG